MKWTRGTRSADVEDRRGQSPRRRATFGIAAVVVALAGAFLGPDAARIVQQLVGTQSRVAAPPPVQPVPRDKDPDRELVEFIHWVHEDLKVAWTKLYAQTGKSYQHPKLVLFTEAVDTGCGYSTAAIGPFYCPPDHKAYIDLTFYRALADDLGAKGDFAQAYVLAHEIGHHVQNLLGTSASVHAAKKREPAGANDQSVRLELQADCYAGLWAHTTQRRDLLELGDLEEGLGAAAAIGDDRLQRRAGAPENSETWTHGSSAQRVRWFRTGLESGQLSACDTFAVPRP